MRSNAVRASVAALVAAAACAADAAVAAQPQAGAYAGATTQPETMPYKGRVRLVSVDDGGAHRIAKITARMKLDCQGDPPAVETYKVTVPAPEGDVTGAGRFRYSIRTTPTSGFTIRGRFVTRTRARGTFGFSDAATGCYVGDVAWTATLR